ATLGNKSVGGIGGTRNCDWWFTDEAVLLDTAGRYTTQDSFAEVDASAWKGFLKLLKQHRRRRPINGVIVALSVTDLLQQNEQQRSAQALVIRQRIQELHEHLGIRFPVYVMVTKCDLLAGFLEFFGDLNREERAQVLGITFPLADSLGDAALSNFLTEFGALETQLQLRVIDRMQSERDPERRALIYGFPQQFSSLAGVLDSFLTTTFQANNFEESALLRGVYFTSGTQEGSPIDRFVGALAAALGLRHSELPAQENSGRSYFITRLLRDLIFREANLAGVDFRLERQRKWLQFSALGAISVFTVVTLILLSLAYLSNQQQIAQVAEQSAELKRRVQSLPEPSDLATLLPVLDTARDLPGGYADRQQNASFVMRLGLPQGAQLGVAGEEAYHALLKAYLLPQLVKRMQDQLARGNANSYDYLYQLLRVYLMLGEPQHFDAAAVRAWIEYDWTHEPVALEEKQKERMLQHVDALLAFYAQPVDGANSVPNSVPNSVQMDSQLLDPQLLAKTRLILATTPLSTWLYERLKNELNSNALPEFSLSNVNSRELFQVLTRRSAQPLTRGVAGLYTSAGYRQFSSKLTIALRELTQNSWVFADQEQLNTTRQAQLKAAVEQLYFDDYIKHWDEFLADIGVKAFSNLDQGARIANLLSGSDSPLRPLLSALAQQTSLEAAANRTTEVDSLADTVKDKLAEYKKQLERALSQNAKTTGGVSVSVSASAPTRNPVDAHFASVHKAVLASAKTPPTLEGLLTAIAQLGQFFAAADTAQRLGTPPPPPLDSATLARDLAGLPPFLLRLLQDLERNGDDLLLDTDRSRLNSLWAASGAAFCRQAIAERYPLAKNANYDITPEDFGKFFGAGGVMDDFFRKHLLQYVNTDTTPWRWRPGVASKLGLSQHTLSEFQRATQIREAFFAPGAKQASLRFTLKALNVSANVDQLLLNIDGQNMNYTKDTPSTEHVFQFPSGKTNGETSLSITPTFNGATLVSEGAWSWFRMLDKGQLETTAQPERFILSFETAGRKAALELKASSVANPFQRELFERFNCLDRL
ncbi:MAG: type VI secretion system membrane subunit TssM, partial [Pseudomonadota bacterium]